MTPQSHFSGCKQYFNCNLHANYKYAVERSSFIAIYM